MSSFSCRNAYGRAKTRLSEHGRVNALDFGAFLTANGETTMVVADWGPSAREIAAEAVKRQAEAAASARKGKTSGEGPRPAVQEPLQAATTIPLPIPRITIGRPSGTPADDGSTGLGWAPPSRLGGPKEADAAAPGPNGKLAFLRAVHKAACGIFSTVLGPEANLVPQQPFPCRHGRAQERHHLQVAAKYRRRGRRAADQHRVRTATLRTAAQTGVWGQLGRR